MPGIGDEFKKVKQGDALSIPHDTWNCLLDVATLIKSRQHDQDTSVDIPNLVGTQVYIINSTGGDLDRFTVVGLDQPLVAPADNANAFAAPITFGGITPTLMDHAGKFAVLTEPCASGSVAAAVVSGVCVVMLNVVNEADQWADVDDGVSDDLMTGSAGSARILWKEAGTGAGIYGVVRISNRVSSPRWGTLSNSTGDNGTNVPTVTNATYVYQVNDFETSAVVAGTDITKVGPAWNRMPGLLAGPGANCLYQVVGGTCYILFTDEQQALVACPTS